MDDHENQKMTTSQLDIKNVSDQVQSASDPFRRLCNEAHQVIVGQDILLHRMMIGLLANGHLLIEGVPGLAKTLAVSTLADGIDAPFQRIQFTPDMLPADIIGTLMYRPNEGDFMVNRGPIFSNVILADEMVCHDTQTRHKHSTLHTQGLGKTLQCITLIHAVGFSRSLALSE